MPDRAALVAVLIMERPLCIRCLAVKSGLSLSQLDEVVGNVAKALQVHRVEDRCRACGITDTTISVDRPR